MTTRTLKPSHHPPAGRTSAAPPTSRPARLVRESARIGGEVAMSGSAAVLDARILVVDDSGADARLIEAILTGCGYTQVTVVTDPRAALELHAAKAFDLVILDVLMPVMSGFDVLRALHASDTELPVPVIFVTAEPEHMKRALEEGARDFISKPVRMVELLSRARNALELGRLMRDSETRYRALVEQSIAGIYILEKGRFTYANPRLCEILGYEIGELGGLSLHDLVVAADHPLIDGMFERRQAGDLGAIPLEVRARRRDGSIVHLSIESKLIDLAGSKAAIGIVQDVTLRKRAEHELHAANQRLRTLSDRVLAIQEEERRRISRELHDDIGQSLVALDIGLHRLEPKLHSSAGELLAECISVISDVREKVHEISVELHPPHLDQLGLQDALRWLVARHHEMTGIEIECRIDDVDGIRIAPAVEAACYRICQEALNNATRHAQARRVTLELAARHERLVVRIADDGVGFDHAAQRAGVVTTGSMGLISMEERARLAGGRFEVQSAPGAGTCISALFPIDIEHTESTGTRERVGTPS